MSKTKGNVLDPEVLVAEHGADAVRFTLAQLDAPGRDIPLDASRMAGYRAFGNKIWNATRFVLTKAPEGRVSNDLDPAELELPERWILARLSATAGREADADTPSTDEGVFGRGTVGKGVNAHLGDFRFDLACHELYQFFWSDFCDWYIEMAKPGLEPATARPRVADVLVTVLERALRLLHPVMPHITEELWQRLAGHDSIQPHTICLAPYPEADDAWSLSPADQDSMQQTREFVTVVRNDRAERVATSPTGTRSYREAQASIEGKDETSRVFAEWLAGRSVFPLLRSLSGLSEVEVVEELPPLGTKHRRWGVDFSIFFPAQGETALDPAKIERELGEVDGNLARVQNRLASRGFAEKAPAQVVAGARRQLAELAARRAALVAELERLVR
jgi:valyl-tRNA synthetase